MNSKNNTGNRAPNEWIAQFEKGEKQKIDWIQSHKKVDYPEIGKSYFYTQKDGFHPYWAETITGVETMSSGNKRYKGYRTGKPELGPTFIDTKMVTGWYEAGDDLHRPDFQGGKRKRSKSKKTRKAMRKTRKGRKATRKH